MNFENHPLISIITITFNAARELPATMKSVNEQTFTDFEHIIVDGASKDNTLQVARKDGGSSLRILSEPDKGLYDAMNKGISLARGKYLLFLNAGDTFHSKTILEKYAEQCHKGRDIIYSDTMIVDSDRNPLRPRHLEVPDLLTFESFANGMLVCHQAFMVKKSIAPYYNLDYRFSADYDWTIRCIKATQPDKCINLKTVGIDYLDNGLTDRNHIKSLKERFHIMRDYYGLGTTVANHISFIGRAFKRKFN